MALIASLKWNILLCSQTWVNEHFWIANTFLQQPTVQGLIFIQSYLWTTTTSHQRPQIKGSEGVRCTNIWLYTQWLNNNHQSTTATNLGAQGWTLNTGLTVYSMRRKENNKVWLYFYFPPTTIFHGKHVKWLCFSLCLKLHLLFFYRFLTLDQ